MSESVGFRSIVPLVAAIQGKINGRGYLKSERFGYEGQVKLVDYEHSFKGVRSVCLDVGSVGVFSWFEEVEVLCDEFLQLQEEVLQADRMFGEVTTRIVKHTFNTKYEPVDNHTL